MKVLFSAHDAGGGNAILPVVLLCAAKQNTTHVVTTGPALNLFRSEQFQRRCAKQQVSVTVADGGIYTSEVLLEAYIADLTPDVFVFGTSAGESIDKVFIRKLQGSTPTIAIMDYWSNYRARFAVVPDRICVIDQEMKSQMIIDGFNEKILIVTGNPYFDHFADGITQANEDPSEILFISQPLSEMRTFTDYGFDEFTVLRDVQDVIQQYAHVTLSIRLHPKDDPLKYEQYVHGATRLSAAKTLEEAISHAGLVIGMISPVLIQAAAAGKRVVSYEPYLSVEDPLISNQHGITRLITTKPQLAQYVADVVSGKIASTGIAIASVWPRGATERVLTELERAALT